MKSTVTSWVLVPPDVSLYVRVRGTVAVSFKIPLGVTVSV